MSILKVPPELLIQIGKDVECPDLNRFLRCHSHLYGILNNLLFQRNIHNTSALCWAAAQGSESTFRHFIDAGANVQWESQYLAHSVQYHGRRFRCPLQIEMMKEHPISHAAAQGHTRIVEYLLDLGADINYRDRDGLTPLALAAREGHLNLTRKFISLGAKQLSHDKEERYPLVQAALNGHHNVEDYLFDQLRQYPYSKPNPRLDLYWMLKYAAEHGDEDRIRYLLAQGADVNFQLSIESHPPLCGALLSPRPRSTTQLLLDYGADPNGKASPSKNKSAGRSERVQSTINLALQRDESYCLINLLIQYGAVAQYHSQALITAIRYGKTREFEYLVETGASLSAKYRRVSVAERAMNSGYQPIIDICLKYGVR
ncbi:hypothetical protein N7481_008801 [Penicillium waksmanii]|uniref:uncharacterized protein n=1 Tax=Penicillium waksmanii TaxID=69791 RepID=UPI002546BD1E|nr:uncharacterized protein N7481_008801 [Penicillium waksmanii]KAJ5975094.1 hypothetical protein N7481_008801 [Penicillium waksmanii]